MKNLQAILAFVFVVHTASLHAAVPRRAASDQQITAQGQLVASGAYLEVYQHGVMVDPSFLKVMESAYEQVQGVTGLKLDTATLGPRVHVYVSDAVTVSHVWKGYEHMSDPRAVIFLNPRVYMGAVRGDNATHIHEMTHLFAWRFNSHTLREGFADYVALKILPGTAVGPNPAGSEPNVPAEISQYLGTTKSAPEWLLTDPVKRAAYYFASRRFVTYLVETKGMETFLKLYASENPDAAIRSLYGMSREEAVQAALR